MVLDTSLLNTQQYKVRIKDKMEQSRETSYALPYTSVCCSYWKGSLDYGRQLFHFFIKIVLEEEINLAWDIRLLIIAFLHWMGHSL